MTDKPKPPEMTWSGEQIEQAFAAWFVDRWGALAHRDDIAGFFNKLRADLAQPTPEHADVESAEGCNCKGHQARWFCPEEQARRDTAMRKAERERIFNRARALDMPYTTWERLRAIIRNDDGEGASDDSKDDQ